MNGRDEAASKTRLHVWREAYGVVPIIEIGRWCRSLILSFMLHNETDSRVNGAMFFARKSRIVGNDCVRNQFLKAGGKVRAEIVRVMLLAHLAGA